MGKPDVLRSFDGLLPERRFSKYGRGRGRERGKSNGRSGKSNGEDISRAERPALWLSATLKFFSEAKNYGFVMLDRHGKDAFLHISCVHKGGLNPADLRSGDRFEVQVEQRDKGLTVTKLRAAQA